MDGPDPGCPEGPGTAPTGTARDRTEDDEEMRDDRDPGGHHPASAFARRPALSAVTAAALVVALSLLPPAALATEHDLDCMPPTQANEDAGNEPDQARALGDAAYYGGCTGEMQVATDPADWYWTSPEDTLGPSRIEVELCPIVAQTGPWNPDLHLYAGNPNPFAGIVEQSILTPDVEYLDGSDEPAGVCDVATAEIPLGEVAYVHVLRTSGDGLYRLRVAVFPL